MRNQKKTIRKVAASASPDSQGATKLPHVAQIQVIVTSDNSCLLLSNIIIMLLT